ncbi:hypothetical protein AYI70_g2170 [Smittium culicis]|uniref:Uncharacterized protein n=1 Tax=Smittium culicis TaxID=133412 RepID=A0A1R1Y9J2_9FUNG|nr:hypothetical protein AYI70_g2170 [Smittium culicis]
MDAVEESEQLITDWKISRSNSLADLVQLLRILYECVKLTFNSPTVMRNIVNTLIRFGDYHEAYLASRTYIEYSRRILDNRKKDFSAMIDRVGDEKNALSEEYKNVYYYCENESIPDMVETLSSSMNLITSFLNKPKEALSIYTLISEIRDSPPNSICIGSVEEISHKYIFARSEISKGMVYGMYSRSDISSEKRCKSHDIAINSFTRAIEMCNHSLNSFKIGSKIYNKIKKISAEAWFNLSLQNAIGGRNIQESLVQVKESLGLDSKNTRAWHLLALLVSTASSRNKVSQSGASDSSNPDLSRNSRISAALKVCEIGLRQNEWWWRVEQDIIGNPQPDTDLKPESTSGIGKTMSSLAPMAPVELDDDSNLGASSEEGIAYIKLRLLHFVLQRELEGPESTLNYMPLLFQLYSRICGPIQALPVDLHDASKSLLALNEQALLPNRSSRSFKYGNGGGSEKNLQISKNFQATGAMSVLSASRMSNLNNLTGLMQPKTLAKSLAKSMLSVRAPVMKWKQTHNYTDKVPAIKSQSDYVISIENLSDENGNIDSSQNPYLTNTVEKMSRKKRFAGKLKNSVKKSFGSKNMKKSVREDAFQNQNCDNLDNSQKKPSGNSNIAMPWNSASSDKNSNDSSSSDESSQEYLTEGSSGSISDLDHTAQNDYNLSKSKDSKKSKNLIKINIAKPKTMINNAINDVKNIKSKSDKPTAGDSLSQPNFSESPLSETSSKMFESRVTNVADGSKNKNQKSPIEGSEVIKRVLSENSDKPASFSVNYFNSISNSNKENPESIIKSNSFNLNSSAIALASQGHRLSIGMQKEYKSHRNSKLIDQKANLTNRISATPIDDPSRKFQSIVTSTPSPNSDNRYLSVHRNEVSSTNSPSISQDAAFAPSPYSTVYFKPTITRMRRCQELSNKLLSQLWMFSSECFLLLEKFEDSITSLSDAAKANPLDPRVMLIRSEVFMAQALNIDKTFSHNEHTGSDSYNDSLFYKSYNIPNSENASEKLGIRDKDYYYELFEPDYLNDLENFGFGYFSDNKAFSENAIRNSYKQEMIKISESEIRAAASLSPHNLDVMISLTKLEFKLGNWEMAYGLASEITQGVGWSNPEAWFILGLLEKKVALGLGIPPILPPFLGSSINELKSNKSPREKNVSKMILRNELQPNSKTQDEFSLDNSSLTQSHIGNEEFWFDNGLNVALFELSSTSDAMGAITDKYDTLNSENTNLNYKKTEASNFNSLVNGLDVTSKDRVSLSDDLEESFNSLQINSSSIEKARILSEMPNTLNSDQAYNKQFPNIFSQKNNLYLNFDSKGSTNAVKNEKVSPDDSTNEGFYSKRYDPSQVNVATSWQRVRHFLSFALELEETQPIEPFESVLML